MNIALDSLKECVVCSTIAKRQNYISEQKGYESGVKLQELAKMIKGIKKFIKKNS